MTGMSPAKWRLNGPARMFMMSLHHGKVAVWKLDNVAHLSEWIFKMFWTASCTTGSMSVYTTGCTTGCEAYMDLYSESDDEWWLFEQCLSYIVAIWQNVNILGSFDYAVCGQLITPVANQYKWWGRFYSWWGCILHTRWGKASILDLVHCLV